MLLWNPLDSKKLIVTHFLAGSSFPRKKWDKLLFLNVVDGFLRRQLFGVGFSLSFQISYTDWLTFSVKLEDRRAWPKQDVILQLRDSLFSPLKQDVVGVNEFPLILCLSKPVVSLLESIQSRLLDELFFYIDKGHHYGESYTVEK